MKVTPQISADLDEYPEIRTIVNAAMRPVVDLMGIHGIVSLKRMHKVGVFDHPYVKDSVVPIDIPAMPVAVKAAQYAAGKALLDYLETVGITGISIEMTQQEAEQLATLWAGPRKAPPEPVPEPQPERRPEPKPEPEPPGQDAPAAEPPEKPETPAGKEAPDGGQAAD